MSKRDLNTAVDAELINCSGREFQQLIRRQENENERALTLHSGLFSLKR